MSTHPDPHAEAARLLDRLDVPACACPLQWERDGEDDGDPDPDRWHLIPCPHVLAAPDHSLTLAEWAELQRLLCPGDYTDPPPPEAPALALRQPARVEVYRQREGHGLHLYHDRDSWRGEESGLRVGVRPLRAPNGATLDGGLTGGRSEAAPLVAELLAGCALVRRLFERGERLLAGAERKAA